MGNRPKIEITLSQTDKIIEIMGWLSVLGLWVLTLANYFEIPETVPTHFNAAGEIDGFGDKTNLLVLPIISTVLFIGLTILNKSPHAFNYPNEITKENALGQYTNATRMIRVLKLVITLIFGLIVFKTLQNIDGSATGLGAWFLPLTIAMVFVPMIYFFINANRNK